MAGDEEKVCMETTARLTCFFTFLGTNDLNLATILEIGSHGTTIIFIGFGRAG